MLPEPLALGPEFSENAKKQEQWKGFITKGQLRADSGTLSNTVESLKQFLMPVCLAASSGTQFDFIWAPDMQLWLQ